MKRFLPVLLPALVFALLLPAAASAQGRKPKITVIGTGGTISGVISGTPTTTGTGRSRRAARRRRTTTRA